jgi:hypothetical protein
MARSAMTQDNLKVLIQDMKRGLDSPLRKVSTKRDPLRPVIKAQCQEREVCLDKGKESRGNELTHYDLCVLPEAEGVTAMESYLLQQTEEELCSTSEVQSKMIFMGHQILSCHVPVVRSLSSCERPCYHLKIFHMITLQNILISPSSIPKSDLVLSHNSSCDDPISTSLVPKSHIVMSHNSSCYDPISTYPVPKSCIIMSHNSSC